MPLFWRLRARLHHWVSKLIGLAFLALIVMAIIWGKDFLKATWAVLDDLSKFHW